MTDATTPDVCEARERKYEMLCGIMLAIFAATLAIAHLAGGRFEGDQMVAVNEKSSAYSWYTSKSIKQTLVEGQLSIMESLVMSGSVDDEQLPAFESTITEFEGKVEKYASEKREILLGSDAVGVDNWVQDIDGEFGVVVGAVEWEDLANKLDNVGNIFDISILFLEICIVLGAVSLIMDTDKIRKVFFAGMNVCGGVGMVIAVVGIVQGLWV